MGERPREAPLGRRVSGSSRYDPALLFPIRRDDGRARLGLQAPLPFGGEDLWHGYELSWLAEDGRPQAALGLFRVPASSPCMVESKSLKLYLNALNGSRFPSWRAVSAVIAADLTAAAGEAVAVSLHALDDPLFHGRSAPGECIDDAPFRELPAAADRSLLRGAADRVVEETLHSHLLRSLCPVTAQPDWATLVVAYRGPQLARDGLLRYVAGFRNHQDFHEQCVERIFRDLSAAASPSWLSVQALYTRRGGISISPWRGRGCAAPPPYRLHRQ